MSPSPTNPIGFLINYRWGHCFQRVRSRTDRCCHSNRGFHCYRLVPRNRTNRIDRTMLEIQGYAHTIMPYDIQFGCGNAGVDPNADGDRIENESIGSAKVSIVVELNMRIRSTRCTTADTGIALVTFITLGARCPLAADHPSVSTTIAWRTPNSRIDAATASTASSLMRGCSGRDGCDRETKLRFSWTSLSRGETEWKGFCRCVFGWVVGSVGLDR